MDVNKIITLLLKYQQLKNIKSIKFHKNICPLLDNKIHLKCYSISRDIFITQKIYLMPQNNGARVLFDCQSFQIICYTQIFNFLPHNISYLNIYNFIFKHEIAYSDYSTTNQHYHDELHRKIITWKLESKSLVNSSRSSLTIFFRV